MSGERRGPPVRGSAGLVTLGIAVRWVHGRALTGFLAFYEDFFPIQISPIQIPSKSTTVVLYI